MVTVAIGGKEIPLTYTTLEMLEIQKQIAPIGRAIQIVMGRNPDDKEDSSLYAGAEHLEAVGKLICILGNAGLEEAGQDPNLTLKKVLRGLRPAMIAEAINACMSAMQEGLASEIPDKVETGPVDVTLEEMKKKEEKAD